MARKKKIDIELEKSRKRLSESTIFLTGITIILVIMAVIEIILFIKTWNILFIIIPMLFIILSYFNIKQILKSRQILKGK